MCPPALIAIASLAGTAMSAYGSIAAGNAQKSQADAQAQLDTRQAVMTGQQGEYQAARKQDEINKNTGAQIAAVSGSGVDISGSPTDVISSSVSEGALDTSAIRYGAKINSDNLMYQAVTSRQAGQAAQQAGVIGAVSSVIGGIGQLGAGKGPQAGAGGATLGNAFGFNGGAAAKSAWSWG